VLALWNSNKLFCVRSIEQNRQNSCDIVANVVFFVLLLCETKVDIKNMVGKPTFDHVIVGDLHLSPLFLVLLSPRVIKYRCFE